MATEQDHIVGFRTFLRWSLRAPDGTTVTAVRAVDTATDPAHQGKGIFTKLTLRAIEELGAEGVRLVFNTPNAKSLPGYVKMGWSVLGRLPTAVMPTRARSLVALAKARAPAERWSIPTIVGEAAAAVFADQPAIEQLLESCPPRRGLGTVRSREYLAWRYGLEPLHYRALLAGASPSEGLVVFRLRQRGGAVEAVVCETLGPGERARSRRRLLRQVARLTGADYLIRLQRAPLARGPFVRLPRTGPILACRPLDGSAVPGLGAWDLSLGDVTLF